MFHLILFTLGFLIWIRVPLNETHRVTCIKVQRGDNYARRLNEVGKKGAGQKSRAHRPPGARHLNTNSAQPVGRQLKLGLEKGRIRQRLPDFVVWRVIL